MPHFIYPWLDASWLRLLQLTKNNLPHAFLFCGPQGIGKKALVRVFEKLVLCRTPTEQGACGKCRSCYLYEQGHHPDHLAQEEESIGIDEIRAMTAFLEESSHQMGKKIITLFNVDKMQTACANALLKTLEEPPVDAVIILIANKLTVLPTIKSRCILINLPLPSTNTALKWLKQANLEVDEKTLQISLHFAGDAPLLAQTFVENFDAIMQMCDGLIEGKASAFDSEQIQQFILSNPQAALYLFYYFLMDYQRFMLTGKTEYLYKDNQMKAIQGLSKRLSLSQASDFVEKIKEALRSLTMIGINKSLMFDALFCEWQLLCHQGNRI